MSDKNTKTKKISGLVDETSESSEIFGKSLSREEVKAQRREEAARRREEAKIARKNARKANAEELKNHRTDIIILACILAVIVVGCIAAFIWQSIQTAEAEKFDRDVSMQYFTNSANMPTLEEERVTAAVQQVYYTNGGYLAVKMLLGNGTDAIRHIDAMYVEIRNGDGELVGSGSSNEIKQTFYIAADDYEEYTFYIAPEYVAITDDPLSTIRYSISIDSDIDN